MKIVFATHNKDKYQEMVQLLKDFSIELLSLYDFPDIREIVEDGSTIKENALIKSRTVYNLTGLYTISDDSGLEVEALNGNPGVHSARYAGYDSSYSDNVNKLLKKMKGFPKKSRKAKFKTIISFIGDNMELISEGIVKGLITNKPKGVGGFGYDPVFYVIDKGKTYSEMTMEEKNQISHRAKAISNMKNLLKSHMPDIFHKMEDIA